MMGCGATQVSNNGLGDYTKCHVTNGMFRTMFIAFFKIPAFTSVI